MTEPIATCVTTGLDVSITLKTDFWDNLTPHDRSVSCLGVYCRAEARCRLFKSQPIAVGFDQTVFEFDDPLGPLGDRNIVADDNDGFP